VTETPDATVREAAAATDTGETAQSAKPAKTRAQRMWVPLGVFGLIAVLFAGSLFSGDPSKLPSALIGKPAPSLALPAIAGLPRGDGAMPGFKTADLPDGKVSIVNFWASWCGPCRVEHPQLMQLAEREDLHVTGINYKDSEANARRFLAQLGNPYQAVGKDVNGSAAIDFGVYGMPETFVLDGQKRIIYRHVGPISTADMEGALKTAIARAKAARTQ